MASYAQILRDSLCSHGWSAHIATPPAVAGSLPWIPNSLRKWIAYVDKYLLFPPRLWLLARKFDVVHICDHSNAMYHPWTGSTPCLITCHDMLAVRGGLGDSSVWCQASWFGRILQRWILWSLISAPFLVFVSHYTRADFLRLTQRTLRADLGVVLNPLNAPFSPSASTDVIFNAFPQLHKTPFLLMVGSSLPRKNREAAIRTMAYLRNDWKGFLVFAGSPLTTAQHAIALRLGVLDRILQIVNPSHELLNSLYVHAHALLFPSYAEGFGWPIIEAQQCDCPVICSTATAIPEVAGDGAVLCNPDDVAAMASTVFCLQDHTFRTQLIEKGRVNSARFDLAIFLSDYLAIYQRISAGRI